MVCCRFFSKLTRRGNHASYTKMRSEYSSEMSSYTSDCKKYSSLKSFDASLHERTNNFVSLLAAQAKTQSLNQESLMDAYGFLLQINQDAVRVIIESKEDINKNKDLESLVDVYFESSSKTLDFCNTVEKCVKKAEISQRLIRFAVKQFEKETDLGGESQKRNKYVKTLEELNKFKAMGDPFDGEFVKQYASVYKQQVLLLEELRKLKVKLDKKRRNVKTLRILSNVVFITAFVAVFAFSVVAAAMTAPPVLTVVAAGLNVPIEVAGLWCDKMCKKYEKAVKRQIGLVESMERGVQGSNVIMDNINFEVGNLKNKISSMLFDVEFAGEREEDEMATRYALEEIKKKVEEFTEKIKQVGERAAMYSKIIESGRIVVLGHILGLPNLGKEAVNATTKGV